MTDAQLLAAYTAATGYTDTGPEARRQEICAAVRHVNAAPTLRAATEVVTTLWLPGPDDALGWERRWACAVRDHLAGPAGRPGDHLERADDALAKMAEALAHAREEMRLAQIASPPAVDVATARSLIKGARDCDDDPVARREMLRQAVELLKEEPR